MQTILLTLQCRSNCSDVKADLKLTSEIPNSCCDCSTMAECSLWNSGSHTPLSL